MTPTHLFAQRQRCVAGLMSGTSLDGIDCVVARLSGTGKALELEILATHFEPFSQSVRRTIRDASLPASSSVKDISQLHALLGRLYARTVLNCLRNASLGMDEIDVAACHGQTIHHVPDPEPFCGEEVASTLQIGDPAVIAMMLGVPVIDHFRSADVAIGGQGAPLVPYFDYVYFTHPHETRGLLNLGGIANLTVLPANAGHEDVRAFDTGPANMVIDEVSRALLNQSRDESGSGAMAGKVSEALLAFLLEDSYYERVPPKSTGRERYHEGYIRALLDKARALDLAPPDVLATATELTARTVYDQYTRFISGSTPLDLLIVAGGGTHNRFLMQRLAELFAPIPLKGAGEYGLDADFKEALCFAVLGHEFLNGTPTNMPSVTGADRPVCLGRLTLPA